MKYISFPLDNTFYTAEAEQLYDSVFSTGVYLHTDFLVSVKSGMTITVAPGRANFNYDDMKGFVFGSYDPVDFTIDIGDSVLNRIDRVVLRHNFITNKTTIVILKGTAASSPVAQTIIRDTTTYYDICVAEIKINAGTITLTNAMINDTRLVEELCGIVSSKVDKIPTNGLTQQWQGWFDSNTVAFQTSFESWFANLKNQLTTNQAANLQNQIDTINTQFEENAAKEITTDVPMTTLTGATDGIINIKSIKGKTRYKKSDGTYTDTWENGVTLESVGKAENNKIVIKSVGKNLLDGNKLYEELYKISPSNVSKVLLNGKTYIKTINNSIFEGNEILINNFEPNSQYAFNYTRKDIGSPYIGLALRFNYLDGTNSIISFGNPDNTLRNFIVNSSLNKTIKSISFSFGTTSTETYIDIDNVQLIKTSLNQIYELYKEDKTEIQLDNPLQGFATYQDEIIPNENKLIKRVTNGILNGTENWTIYKQSSTILSVHFETIDGLNGTRFMMADKFKNLNLDQLEALTEEGVFAGTGTNAMSCFLNIAKTKLSSPDVAGVKAWLVNNNVKIVYALKTPIEKNIYPSTLKSFKNGSLILENAITPIVNLEYTSNIASRIEILEDTVDLLGENRSEYEIGKWTPVIALGNSGTIIPSITDGSYYERVNNKITAYFTISVQGWSVSNPNELLILSALPFPARNNLVIGIVSDYDGVLDSSGASGGIGLFFNRSNVFQISLLKSTGSTGAVLAHFGQNFYIKGKLEYTL